MGLLLFLGPLEFILAFKLVFTNMNIAWQIKDVIPNATYISNKRFEGNKAATIITDIFMWLFVMFVTGLGLLGMLLAPFYAFLK